MDELINKIIEKVRGEFEGALKAEFERGKSEGGGGGKISPEKIAAVQGLIDKYEEDEKQEAEDLKGKIKEELEKEEAPKEEEPTPEPTPDDGEGDDGEQPPVDEEPAPPVEGDPNHEEPATPEPTDGGVMGKSKKR